MADRSRRPKKTGKFATPLALAAGGGTLAAAAMTTAILIGRERENAIMVGLTLSVVAGLVVGLAVFVMASGIGQKLTDLALAVARLGRGSGEVRIRVSPKRDEVGALGRAVQFLANDVQALFEEAESGGGAMVTADPQVRGLRDNALDQQMPRPEGWELDGTLEPGSRGGVDYYGTVEQDDGTILYLVTGDGTTSISVVAGYVAQQELSKALAAGATPRKALSHTNRVLHRVLPQGACAKATVVQLLDDGAKLYMAGSRTPLLLCKAGELLESEAEGIALGLDDGTVFDKGLRPTTLEAPSGTRLVLLNESGDRMEGIHDLLVEHSPMNTMAFVNMVLGGLEQDVGEGGFREDLVLVTAKRMA